MSGAVAAVEHDGDASMVSPSIGLASASSAGDDDVVAANVSNNGAVHV